MSAMAPRSMLNAVLMAARFQFRTSLSIPCHYPRVSLNRFSIASKNSFSLDIWKSSEQANLKPWHAERFFSNCTRNKISHRIEGLLSAKLVATLSSSLGAPPILFFPPRLSIFTLVTLRCLFSRFESLGTIENSKNSFAIGLTDHWKIQFVVVRVIRRMNRGTRGQIVK